MNFIDAVLIAFLAVLLMIPAAHAASCTYGVGGSNRTVTSANTQCAEISLIFYQNATNSSFYCTPGHSVVSALFENNTYNDTIYDCNFANAKISGMHMAFNNLINASGNYTFEFADNLSNFGVGYYFQFVPLDYLGNVGTMGFASVMPYSLVRMDPMLARSQGANRSWVLTEAKANGLSIPRFGVYVVGPVSNKSPSIYKVETSEVYRNHTIDFNPYWIVCPYWGWDELTSKELYIFGNKILTPVLIYPRMKEFIQYPDNTNVYWNYTVINYENVTNANIALWDGYQASPNGFVVTTLHNFTSGNINYDRGPQVLGIHETIAVLKSADATEQDNSTTETYSIGISFCTQNMPFIQIPGHYSFVYGSLHPLNWFWITNETCATALTIQSDNVIIDCKGGTINSTGYGLFMQSVKNVTVKNCNIYGNVINVSNSEGIYLTNSTFYAHSWDDVGITATHSNLTLLNDRFIGYKTRIFAVKSTITVHNATIAAASTVQIQGTPKWPAETRIPIAKQYELAGAFSFMLAALSIIHWLLARKKR